MLNSVKKYQADREENTCLIREDLEAIVVENQTEKTIHKKKEKGVITIAPGENKVIIKFSLIMFLMTIYKHNFTYFFISRFQTSFWQTRILMLKHFHASIQLEDLD